MRCVHAGHCNGPGFDGFREPGSTREPAANGESRVPSPGAHRGSRCSGGDLLRVLLPVRLEAAEQRGSNHIRFDPRGHLVAFPAVVHLPLFRWERRGRVVITRLHDLLLSRLPRDCSIPLGSSWVECPPVSSEICARARHLCRDLAQLHLGDCGCPVDTHSCKRVAGWCRSGTDSRHCGRGSHWRAPREEDHGLVGRRDATGVERMVGRCPVSIAGGHAFRSASQTSRDVVRSSMSGRERLCRCGHGRQFLSHSGWTL